MLGFLVRAFGCLLLAAATAFAIGDIARSLSAEALRLTSVGEAAGYVYGAAPAATAEGAQALWAAVSPWPVSPTLAAVALAILVLGRQRRPAGSLN